MFKNLNSMIGMLYSFSTNHYLILTQPYENSSEFNYKWLVIIADYRKNKIQIKQDSIPTHGYDAFNILNCKRIK